MSTTLDAIRGWTYLQFDDDGERMPGTELPPPETAYLAFDVLRWCVVIGYTERGGFSAFLAPNVDDDCQVVAFAPFGCTEAPDENKIRANCPWRSAAIGYAHTVVPILLR